VQPLRASPVSPRSLYTTGSIEKQILVAAAIFEREGQVGGRLGLVTEAGIAGSDLPAVGHRGD